MDWVKSIVSVSLKKHGRTGNHLGFSSIAREYENAVIA